MEYRKTGFEAFNGPCLNCGLYAGCESGKMPGEGSSNPVYLFVGEAPGEMEDKYNRPFVGSTGSLLRSVIDDLGIPEEQCRFTNAVRCRPLNNRTPKATEIKYCKTFLEAEIAQVKPKVVILLGNVPLTSVLGEKGITAWNGTAIQRDGMTIVPAYHPSFVQRGGVQGEVLDDWLMALMTAKNAGEGKLETLEYNIVIPETIDELQHHVDRLIALHLQTGINIAYDIEGRWLQPEREGSAITLFSLAVDNEAVVVPLHHRESWFKDSAYEVKAVLSYVLQNYSITGHNVRFDQKVTRVTEGIDFVPAGDTLNLSRLLFAHDKAHGLKRLAAIHLNMYDYDKPIDDYKKAHPEANPAKGGDFGLVPLNLLLPYAGLDAICCSKIEQKLYPMLDDKQRILYHQLIQPASDTLGRLEQNGFYVDRVMTDRYVAVYKVAKQRYLNKLLADPDVQWYIEHKKESNKKFVFNPGSDPQMRDIIFGVKGYKPLALTETKLPSVSWDVIKVYKDEEPFFEHYRMWNLMGDMLSKYLGPPQEGSWFFGNDDRCRVNFNLGGATSGRISSSDPTNLQNIPTTEKEYGTLLMYKPIKNIFTASEWAVSPTGRLAGDPEWLLTGQKWGPLHPYRQYEFPTQRGRLVAIDFNGQELRVMASVANVPGMIAAFNEGRDIHSFVTALIFHVPEEHVKKMYNHLRYRAKWVNWTLLFGGDEYTLHGIYGIPIDEAKVIVKAYYKAFPEVLDFQNATRQFVAEHGYVQSIMGRRLKLHYVSPEDRRRNPALYANDMRTAINMPIQGPASDLLLLAMNVVQYRLRTEGYRAILVNSVHDSMVLDSPLEEVEAVAQIGTEVMENLPAYGKIHFPDIDLSWLRVNLKAETDVSIWYGSH